MLIHLVVFKYKADTGEAQRAEHVRQLESLRERVPGIRRLDVGADVVRTARSYDTGLLVEFDDRAGLDAYASHPAHVPVAGLGRSLCEHIVSVDFERNPRPGGAR